MNEFFMAFLILLGLFLAVKIIHLLMQVISYSSLLVIFIVLALLVAGYRDLQIPTIDNETTHTIVKSIEKVEFLFK